MKKVEIYTDGSCLGNPGVGGWAALLIYKNENASPEKSNIEKIIKGSAMNTTNNIMELTAAIEALKILKEPCEVSLSTDSSYLKDGIEKWIFNWKKNNWKLSNKKDVKNKELWEQLDEFRNLHNVNFFWVKAHNGNYYNEKVDTVAREEASKLVALQIK